ncbi:MAG: hypothetical protein GXP25_24190 [Planctomycetes bacterium]|nr:hypothetical protein [Planctomycetota bacterium]
MGFRLPHSRALGASVWLVSLLLHTTVWAQADGHIATRLPEDIVARVNGEKITRRELADELIHILGKRALERMIRLKLIEQEARKYSIDATPGEVSSRLDALVNDMIRRQIAANRLNSEEEFDKFLRRTRGITLETVKDQTKAELRMLVRAEVLSEKILAKIVTVSPEDVRAAYDKKYGTTIRARQIVLQTQADAKAMLAKLKAGADFELLAREKSIDVATRARGGEMRPLSTHSKLGAAVKNVQPGGLSDIVRTDDGYHILKVIERNEKKKVPFEQVKDSLRKAILKRRIDERKASWQAKLFEQAEIEKFL